MKQNNWWGTNVFGWRPWAQRGSDSIGGSKKRTHFRFTLKTTCLASLIFTCKSHQLKEPLMPQSLSGSYPYFAHGYQRKGGPTSVPLTVTSIGKEEICIWRSHFKKKDLFSASEAFVSCISDCTHGWNPPLPLLLLCHWFILQLYVEKYSRNRTSVWDVSLGITHSVQSSCKQRKAQFKNK